jgi:DNA-directed RNA polymerase specialized sigma24 family protein
VNAAVRTSPVNVEDACGFAWLQLVCRRPSGETVFGWLCTTAIREAIRLDRRARRVVEIDCLAERLANDPRLDPEHRAEVLAIGQVIASADLAARERRLTGLRVLGYTRRQMAALTGESDRTIDRQLVRARRKLRDARQRSAEVG